MKTGQNQNNMGRYQKVNEKNLNKFVDGDYICYIGHIDTFVILHFNRETKEFSHPLMDVIVENITECKLIRETPNRNWDITKYLPGPNSIINYNGVKLKVVEYSGPSTTKPCGKCYFKENGCHKIKCMTMSNKPGVYYEKI